MSSKSDKKRKVIKDEDEDEEEEFKDDDDDDDDDESKDDDDDDDSEEDEKPKAKKNDEGEAYFELGKSRRCTVRSFKGKVLVDFREFYEKDGKQLPGKKGISLSQEQYNELKKLVKGGYIDKQIKKMR